MPKFAANLSLMFPDLEPAARFTAARNAGFTAAEYLQPYDLPLADLKRWLDDAGVQLILINSPSGDPARGERGLAALPGREADFRESLDRALTYATTLGVEQIHLMAGIVPEGTSQEACEETFIENLRMAAKEAAAKGVRLMLEPLNSRDAPGYLHNNTTQTRRLIERAGVENLYLQYDLYHMQIMEGDLVEGMRRNFDIIGHMQFSCVPGRHEPQYGEVNFPYVFDQIDALGYDGWLGAEYRPRGDTLEGLTWGRPYGIGPR